MKESAASSQEMLDQILSEGRISDDDYLRLSKALNKQPEDEAGPGGPQSAGGSGSPKKLHKSWHNRQLGGICGGIGQACNIDPIIVRILAVILLFAAPPITVLVYVILYFTLSWDDEAAAFEPQREGHPWLFALIGALLLTVIPAVISRFVYIKLRPIFSQSGEAMPLAGRWLFTVSSGYDTYLIWFSLFCVIAGTVVYLLIHHRKIRLAYALVCGALSAAWCTSVIAALFWTMLRLP